MCYVYIGSIRGASRGPRAPLAALIPLLHRGPSNIIIHAMCISLIIIFRYVTGLMFLFNLIVGLYKYRPMEIGDNKFLLPIHRIDSSVVG